MTCECSFGGGSRRKARRRGLKPTAAPGYMRNFRDLNRKISQGKSFSGYERKPLFLNLKGNGFADVAGLLRRRFRR